MYFYIIKKIEKGLIYLAIVLKLNYNRSVNDDKR